MVVKLLTGLMIFALLTTGDAGCTKHVVGPTGPEGPAGPAGANGASVNPSPISGYIDLYNQYGITDSSSAGVTLSAMNGDSLVTATTDSSGQFSFPPLPPGNYDIHIIKTGFDSLKTFVQHSGGNEPKFIGVIRMDQSLTTLITDQSLGITSAFGDNVLLDTVTFGGPPQTSTTTRYFGFYFSRSKNISTTNYDVYQDGGSRLLGTNQQQLQYDLSNISYSGFNYSPGDTVYVEACVTPFPDIRSTWFNYTTYQEVSYPYLGDSVVNYFVWPN